MASDQYILGFDTSAAHCAAALLKGEHVLGTATESMTRGQAEALMPMLEDLLADHGIKWSDLAAIGVGIGPGNFTGIRISVSAARGLALALGVPAVGISTFDASLYDKAENSIAVVPAPRDQAYILEPDGEPRLSASPIEEATQPIVSPPEPAVLATNIALCARKRMAEAPTRPAPLYVRAADAAPSRDLPPKIL
ncbi:tRNA (adenosine(37)-N6)-threonylcarbamoyltransferase complex dimerization subunit type 1 TsaB [Cognatishimia maritima]|uniref:tRNA threonylcarbamoyl adenosine modification protein YeaZ n=1 Tax=Cognatishimia maritima TaxID=870908 RepID=A0A1M5RZ02_9RHOB|nr:tRNA (adenosine(37)-N6)-threonylcarbamoyltransferase complex dimerization subunit type 1 TsaB [Cognatishimia maritima]SHH31401.1 tRNA threonylcarbamoyl adenosine modification protein YeaZ [Cognatishimia maritima]